MQINMLDLQMKTEEEIKTLKEERVRLVKHQSTIQRKIMDVKKLASDQEDGLLKKLQLEASETGKALGRITPLLKEANVAATKISEEIARLKREDERKSRVEMIINRSPEEAPTKTALIGLLNKYMQFSEDFTRVNSMRLMAAQFAREIAFILDANRKEMQ